MLLTTAAAAAEKRGLLSEESREPVLQFVFWKSLPYKARLTLMAVLALVGLTLQLTTLQFKEGGVFIVAAAALSWVWGFDNKLDRRAFHHDQAWEGMPFDKVLEVLDLDKRITKWDRSALDISNPLGVAGFLVMAAIGYLLWLGHERSAYEQGANIALIDGAILVLTHWFIGMRTVFQQPDLIVKCQHLKSVFDEATRSQVERQGELRAQMLMQGKGDARVPTDVKVSVHFPDAPESFLGVQAQVVLNRVQGTPYPYFYSVVVAREGSGLLQDAEALEVPNGLIRETKVQDDVEVVILRQFTTETSGYHTRPDTSRRTIQAAIHLASRHLSGR